MATLTETLNQPVTPRDANGIARSTPKADRPGAKAAWVTWVANKKAHLYSGGSDPGKFDYTGFTYADEGGGFSGTTYVVTVAFGSNQYGSGNKYYIQNVKLDIPIDYNTNDFIGVKKTINKLKDKK